MDIKQLIESMTREDFLLREERKKLVMEFTKEEKEQMKKERIEGKEKKMDEILNRLGIAFDKSNLEKVCSNVFSKNRSKYQQLLGTKEVYADLDAEAKILKQDYEAFLDFFIKYEGDVVDGILQLNNQQ